MGRNYKDYTFKTVKHFITTPELLTLQDLRRL